MYPRDSSTNKELDQINLKRESSVRPIQGVGVNNCHLYVFTDICITHRFSYKVLNIKELLLKGRFK